jgi:hypothetical protein
VDDETEEEPCGRLTERGSDDTRQQGKGGQEDDMTGEGPAWVKGRVAEKDETAHEPLIRAPRSWPSENCIRDSGPPPLRLKVERRGGSGIAFIAVDPGAQIWIVGEVRPRFRTPPPPPRLKVERQGGSGIQRASLIRARESQPFKLDFRLT